MIKAKMIGLLIFATLSSCSSIRDAGTALSGRDRFLPHASSVDPVLAPLISVSDPEAQRFKSVGRVNLHTEPDVGGLGCTATLVAGSAEPSPDKQAVILTAGHCVKNVMGDNEVVVDLEMGQPQYSSFTPEYFFDNQAEHLAIAVDRVLYGTMKKRDLALVSLKATYGELKTRRLTPLVLKAMTGLERNVESAHVPAGLFPNHFLRHSVCTPRATVALYETEQTETNPWFWERALPTNCIGVYGGSSGAPLVEHSGVTVIGVLSTGLDESERYCGAGRPCEVEDGRPSIQPGSIYFSPVNELVAVLKADGSVDLGALDPGSGVGLERIGGWTSPPQEPDVAGRLRPASWNLRIDSSLESIRYKTGFADALKCDDPKGYGPPQGVAEQPLLSLPVGPQVGVYILCAVGIRAGTTVWQPFDQATVKLRQIVSPSR
jgi:V8-like Glu-specific endopeptidase